MYGHDAETIIPAEEYLRQSLGKHSLNSTLFTAVLLLLRVSDIGAPNGQPFSVRLLLFLRSILRKHRGAEVTAEVQSKQYIYFSKFLIFILLFFILH